MHDVSKSVKKGDLARCFCCMNEIKKSKINKKNRTHREIKNFEKTNNSNCRLKIKQTNLCFLRHKYNLM